MNTQRFSQRLKKLELIVQPPITQSDIKLGIALKEARERLTKHMPGVIEDKALKQEFDKQYPYPNCRNDLATAIMTARKRRKQFQEFTQNYYHGGKAL